MHTQENKKNAKLRDHCKLTKTDLCKTVYAYMDTHGYTVCTVVSKTGC